MRSSRYRTIASLLAITAAGLLFGGLAGCRDNQARRPSIKFWAYGAEPWRSTLQDLIAAFNRRHPESLVKFEAFPGYHQKLMYAFAAKKPPDVAMMDTWMVSQYVGHDLVAPLDFDALDLDPADFFPCGLDAWRKDGEIYGIPLNLNSGGATLLYNIDHLQAEGIPVPPRFASWRALFEAAKKLTRFDAHGNMTRAGFSTRTWDFLGVTNIIKALGGEFIDERGQRIFFDTREGETALQLWLYPTAEGNMDSVLLPSGESAIFQGTASMTVLDSDIIAQGKAEYPQTRIGVDTIPKVIRETDPVRGQFVTFGPWAMCISRCTKNRDLAVKLVRFLNTKRNRLDYLKRCMAMPARKSLAGDAYYTDPAQAGYRYRTLLEDASTWRFAGHLGQVNKIMWHIFAPEIEKLRGGNTRIDDAADRLTKYCTQAMRNFYANP